MLQSKDHFDSWRTLKLCVPVLVLVVKRNDLASDGDLVVASQAHEAVCVQVGLFECRDLLGFAIFQAVNEDRNVVVVAEYNASCGHES